MEILDKMIDSSSMIEKRDNVPVLIRTPQMDLLALFNCTFYDNMIVMEHNGEKTARAQIIKHRPATVGVCDRTCKVLYQGIWSDGTLALAVRFDYYERYPEKRPLKRFYPRDAEPKGDCGGLTVGEYFGRQMYLGECEHLSALEEVDRVNHNTDF